MGAVLFNSCGIQEICLSQKHLSIHDSTWAECAGLAYVSSQIHNKNLVIHCDSQAAIKLCQLFINYEQQHTQVQHICHSNILSQGH